MSTELIVRPEAEEDLAQASSWYSQYGLSLRNRFIQRVEAVFERIQKRPKQFSIVTEGVRRAVMRDFPYSIYFQTEADTIIIIAVLHQGRNPALLDHRLN